MGNINIGERLTALRKEQHQSKRYVSKMVGCSYSSLCKYEYNLRTPSDEMKQKLAKHYGVTVESIFFAE